MTIWTAVAIFAVLLISFAAGAGPARAEGEPDWTKIVSFSGYLDARASFSSWTPDVEKGVAEEVNSSDIKVFEAAVAPHMALTDFLSADAVFYYIDVSNGDHTGRSESLTVDEYYMTLEQGLNKGKSGTLFVKMGKYYPPVGAFKSYGIGYTRVQDLVWTRVSGIGAGYDHRCFGLSFHVFNGDFDNVEEKFGAADPSDDAIDNYAAAVRLSPIAFMDGPTLDLGGYLLSDAAETLRGMGGLLSAQDIANTPNDASDDVVLYQSDVLLYGVYLNGEVAFGEMFGLGLAAEYASTGEWDKDAYTDAAGDATAVSGTQAELAALIDNKRVQVGGKYGAVKGLDWLGTAGLDKDGNGAADDFKPTEYAQFGGFIGVDYLDPLHLAVHYLAGVDNESNKDSLAEFQAKVTF